MYTSTKVSSSDPSIRELQYVVPSKAQLYIQSRIDANPLQPSQFKHLWQTQAILIMAHIFELLDKIEVIVDSEPNVEIRGQSFEKPCLVLERDEKLANAISPAFEVECRPTQIICEHWYKYYIFTHQVEKREERIPRPIITGDPNQSEPDQSEWIVQPKNSNALVR